MTDRQVRDEVMTLFLAGPRDHRNALAWTWYLPVTASRGGGPAALELREVLAGRSPRWRGRAAASVHPD